ncbi:MAG TPA: hypothetical protein VLF41_03785 [Candidatus Nanoarchaeia archaeon]|nr:hypothetical protein [Candidatus Nanoarchaeia archaeon]
MIIVRTAAIPFVLLLVLLLIVVSISLMLLDTETGDGPAGTLLDKAGLLGRWVAGRNTEGVTA